GRLVTQVSGRTPSRRADGSVPRELSRSPQHRFPAPHSGRVGGQMSHLELSLVEPLDAFIGAAETPERRINLSLTEERQTKIRRTPPRPGSPGTHSRENPSKIDQRAEWRRRNRAGKGVVS